MTNMTMIDLPVEAAGREGVQVERDDLSIVLGVVAAETGREIDFNSMSSVFGVEVAVRAEAVRAEVLRRVEGEVVRNHRPLKWTHNTPEGYHLYTYSCEGCDYEIYLTRIHSQNWQLHETIWDEDDDLTGGYESHRTGQNAAYTLIQRHTCSSTEKGQ